MQEGNITMKRTQIAVILILAVLLLAFGYRMTSQKQLSTEGGATNTIPLDKEKASQVMVLGYVESGKDVSQYPLRVDIPHEFDLKPEKITFDAGSENQTNIVTKGVQATDQAYRCMDMSPPGHTMMGYQTSFFTEGAGKDLDTKFLVTFKGTDGKQYSSEYTLEHICTVFSTDKFEDLPLDDTSKLPKD